MNLTTQARDHVLAALDPFFAKLGFVRAARSQAWRKTQSDEHIRCVHLNCALYEKTREIAIIPTMSVRHRRLADLQVALGWVAKQYTNESSAVALSLTVLAGREPHYAYQVEATTAAAIAGELTHDLSAVGLRVFDDLENLD